MKNHLITEKSTVTRHFRSEVHIGNKKGGKENSKKQTTLKTTLPVKTEARVKNSENLEKMFAAAYIPLNFADNPHVRDYFSKNIRGGGAIPRTDALNH